MRLKLIANTLIFKLKRARKRDMTNLKLLHFPIAFTWALWGGSTPRTVWLASSAGRALKKISSVTTEGSYLLVMETDARYFTIDGSKQGWASHN